MSAPSDFLTETGPPPKTRSAAIAFIFVTIVLDVLAFGIIIPVLPTLVESFLGGDTGRAARVFGLFGTIWALMQFIFSPVLGVLSDRYGRRRVILLSNFGLGLDFIVMALAPTVGWLFLGRMISGITGASYATAGAYIADVTPKEKRAAGYGIMGAAWGLGFIVGPAFGGLLGGVNPRLPFWTAAGLTLLNAMYGLFVLPESLPPERRRAIDWKRANPVGALKLLQSHRELFGIAMVTFFFYLAHQALPSVFVLYGSYRYGWNEQTIGLTLAGVGLAGVVVQAGLVKMLVTRFGERATLMIGLVFGTLGFSIFGLASTGPVVWLGIPVLALQGLYGPSAQGIMSHHVSPSEQGELQGANSSILGITGLFGPILFTTTFATFIGPRANWHVPGAPFLLAAGLVAVAIVLARRVTRGE
jgi:DHA1 family tetracycline resistance protein-like MFS transporter